MSNQYTHGPNDQLPSAPKQHPLHIPEVMEMIVAHLTPKEILYCRGVCKAWRGLFSPFLQLHVSYRHTNASDKAKFEARLDTLGVFVQSLQEIHPVQADLERIQRTCPTLKRAAFWMVPKSALNNRVLIRFWKMMPTLEHIQVHTFYSSMLLEFLLSLASYQTSRHHHPSESEATSSTHSSSLRSLEIKTTTQTFHAIAPPVMEWQALEIVLDKHPGIKELTLRCGQVRTGPYLDQGWAWTLFSWMMDGSLTQRVWDKALDTIFNLPDALLTQWHSGFTGGSASTNMPLTPSTFHLESIVLVEIELPEELLVDILCRCPTLKSLYLHLQHRHSHATVWPQCLPCCPLLESVTIKGGVEMDVAQFLTLAPPTLTTLHVHSDEFMVHFATLDLQMWLDTSVVHDPNPGSTLVSLELCSCIRLDSKGVSYVMTNCRALQRLVLGFQYFAQWDAWGVTEAFPAWACGGSLKQLELRTVYRRDDQHLDQRIHGFMKRLEDLKVLTTLILPVKLLSDLSESQNEEYVMFRALLDLLDLLALNREMEQTQPAATSSSSSSPQPFAPLPETIDMEPHPLNVWRAGGTGLVGFIPPLPSVRKVTLTCTRDIRSSMEMRYLHILMQALPGLRTIWTSRELFERGCLSRFKQIHGRFQELYGSTHVELNLGEE
ncbi:hypothetical protein BGX34_008996 [Mortierella sp. NVP85]|nr:hypothetical protein BGX34_008996 [Mortierella sp. NVP85]